MHANKKIKIKNYSRRIPQWKIIEEEIKQLTQQYEQVYIIHHSSKYSSTSAYLFIN